MGGDGQETEGECGHEGKEGFRVTPGGEQLLTAPGGGYKESDVGDVGEPIGHGLDCYLDNADDREKVSDIPQPAYKQIGEAFCMEKDEKGDSSQDEERSGYLPQG